MERIIRFYPAWDKRHKDPDKNYGVHGVEMRWLLKGEKGVVQFVVSTKWFLEKVENEMKHSHDWPYSSDGHYCPFKPLATDLGYHSPVPLYEGQEPVSDNCEFLDGRTCYYDGSNLMAESLFKILTEKGDEAVWKEMEKYYKARLED